MSENGPRAEVVSGRRVETVEFGLRTPKDNIFYRKGHVEQMSSLERAVDCRDRPFCGRQGDEQVVTRTIVTYTTDWTVVPGHEGSRHLSCDHPDTPQGRPSGNMFAQGPDYQLPHAFRERDMTAGVDGVRRYTCPVCGLVWRLPAQQLLTLF